MKIEDEICGTAAESAVQHQCAIRPSQCRGQTIRIAVGVALSLMSVSASCGNTDTSDGKPSAGNADNTAVLEVAARALLESINCGQEAQEVSDDEVKAFAAQWGSLESAHACHALVRALEDSTCGARVAVVVARDGPRFAECAPVLHQLAEAECCPHPEFLLALVGVDPSSQLTLMQLLKSAKRHDSVGDTAVCALARLAAPLRESAVEWLQTELERGADPGRPSDEDQHYLSVLSTIVRYGASARPLARALVAFFQSFPWLDAGEALGAVGGQACSDAILEALHAPAQSGRVLAGLLGAQKLEVPSSSIIEAVTDLLDHELPRVRWNAALVAAKMPACDGRCLEKLVKQIEDQDWRVRYYAIQALGDLGVKTKSIRDAILRARSDRDANVRGVATRVAEVLFEEQ